jgi:hypothetical protein
MLVKGVSTSLRNEVWTCPHILGIFEKEDFFPPSFFSTGGPRILIAYS